MQDVLVALCPKPQSWVLLTQRERELVLTLAGQFLIISVVLAP